MSVHGDVPLFITTTPKSPYDDAFGPDGLLQYRDRGTDPQYLRFTVAVDDAEHVGLGSHVEGWDSRGTEVREGGAEIRRRYVTSLVRARLHQRAFRERVLEAYRRECAFCRFRPVFTGGGHCSACLLVGVPHAEAYISRRIA